MADHLECYPVELLSFKKQKPFIVREDVIPHSYISRSAGGQTKVPFLIS